MWGVFCVCVYIYANTPGFTMSDGFWGFGVFFSQTIHLEEPLICRAFITVEPRRSRLSHLNETCLHTFSICCMFCFILPKVLPAFRETAYGVAISSWDPGRQCVHGLGQSRSSHPVQGTRSGARDGPVRRHCSSRELFPYSALLKKLA